MLSRVVLTIREFRTHVDIHVLYMPGEPTHQTQEEIKGTTTTMRVKLKGQRFLVKDVEGS